jgi:hypothetical protein
MYVIFDEKMTNCWTNVQIYYKQKIYLIENQNLFLIFLSAIKRFRICDVGFWAVYKPKSNITNPKYTEGSIFQIKLIKRLINLNTCLTLRHISKLPFKNVVEKKEIRYG